MALSLRPHHRPIKVPDADGAAPALYAPAVLAERLQGKLCEIGRPATGGQTSLASALVASAQRRRQSVAWLQPRDGGLYAPDLAAAGIDVAALAVLHVGAPNEAALRLRAAEWLLTGGGFGLVVIDLNDGAPTGLAWQGRLLQLVRQHQSSVLLLTSSAAEAPSLGALVSLRLWPEPAGPVAPAAAAFDLQITVLKNKLAPLPGALSLPCCGPLELQG